EGTWGRDTSQTPGAWTVQTALTQDDAQVAAHPSSVEHGAATPPGPMSVTTTTSRANSSSASSPTLLSASVSAVCMLRAPFSLGVSADVRGAGPGDARRSPRPPAHTGIPPWLWWTVPRARRGGASGARGPSLLARETDPGEEPAPA